MSSSCQAQCVSALLGTSRWHISERRGCSLSGQYLLVAPKPRHLEAFLHFGLVWICDPASQVVSLLCICCTFLPSSNTAAGQTAPTCAQPGSRDPPLSAYCCWPFPSRALTCALLSCCGIRLVRAGWAAGRHVPEQNAAST